MLMKKDEIHAWSDIMIKAKNITKPRLQAEKDSSPSQKE